MFFWSPSEGEKSVASIARLTTRRLRRRSAEVPKIEWENMNFTVLGVFVLVKSR